MLVKDLRINVKFVGLEFGGEERGGILWDFVIDDNSGYRCCRFYRQLFG